MAPPRKSTTGRIQNKVVQASGYGARLHTVINSNSPSLLVRNVLNCEVMLNYIDPKGAAKHIVLQPGKDNQVDLYVYAPKLCWLKSDSLVKAAAANMIEIMVSMLVTWSK